ncbi:hypothetical protein BFL36_06025 [Clavibacter michiganensis]|uniref:Uncharacterized protein n=1 Tax=Clavibacter michiganensis TaxID=28447 RepID=A0A251YK42_9MICO|nr:hypothetical protein [Clavibacter michiganensis]OUE24626.1 hypothetical protein BFL36_06025 [Clavibacter michiganensis]
MTADAVLPELASVPDARSVEEAARAFDGIAPAVDDAMHTVTSSWAGLSSPGVFETPDSGRLADSLAGALAVARTVEQDSSTAKAALLAYARELQDLSRRHAVISMDVAAQVLVVRDPFELDRQLPDDSDTDPHQQLEALISQFNADLQAADARCAQALQRLLRYRGDQAVRASEAVNDIISLPAVGLVLATGKQALENSAGPRDYFLGITDALGMTGPGGRHAAGAAPIKERSIGLALRAAINPNAVFEKAADGASAAEHLAEGSRALKIGAKFGGPMLGAVSAVAIGAASASETYIKDMAEHPEWDDKHRDGHAARSGAVHGGFDFAAGAAEAGIGAGIGTLICPGIGTLVGGVIGGVAGGLVFSDKVDHLADQANELIDSHFGK